MKTISFEELTKAVREDKERMSNVAKHKEEALKEIENYKLERYKKFPPFITTYKSIGGWKAVLLTISDEDDSYEPFNTGIGAYDTQEEAEKEARVWAENEEIEFRKGTGEV